MDYLLFSRNYVRIYAGVRINFVILFAQTENITMNYLLKPEELEARTLVEYLSLLQTSGRVQVYTHISNETYTTSWRQKHKNRIMGVKRGVPDYLIVTADSVIFLELKRVKGGVVSPEQKVWIEALEGKQTHAKVCKGFDEARAFVDKYIHNL